ncbi:hypothetical protein D3C77_677370 [compost metagenome]
MKHKDQKDFKHMQNEEIDRIINFEGPHGPIEVIITNEENPNALSDFYNTLAEIMVRQAIKKSRENH